MECDKNYYQHPVKEYAVLEEKSDWENLPVEGAGGLASAILGVIDVLLLNERVQKAGSFSGEWVDPDQRLVMCSFFLFKPALF
jgi:hypothetical protein